MTKAEAYDLCEKFTDEDCGLTKEALSRIQQGCNMRMVDKSDGSYRFVKYLYDNNMEIVYRTIDEDTARNLDNELSEGE